MPDTISISILSASFGCARVGIPVWGSTLTAEFAAERKRERERESRAMYRSMFKSVYISLYYSSNSSVHEYKVNDVTKHVCK